MTYKEEIKRLAAYYSGRLAACYARLIPDAGATARDQFEVLFAQSSRKAIRTLLDDLAKIKRDNDLYGEYVGQIIDELIHIDLELTDEPNFNFKNEYLNGFTRQMQFINGFEAGYEFAKKSCNK